MSFFFNEWTGKRASGGGGLVKGSLVPGTPSSYPRCHTHPGLGFTHGAKRESQHSLSWRHLAMMVARDRGTARGILWRAFKRPPCSKSIFV